MSEKMNESLSALMDGEADELELRRTLNELSENDELRSRWERYHLISAVLKKEPQIDHVRIKTGIWAALDLEEGSQSEDILISANKMQASDIRSWRGNLGKLAVAATVAIAVVLGVNTGTDSGLDSGQPAQLVAESNVAKTSLNNENVSSEPGGLLVANTDSTAGNPIIQQAGVEFMSKHPTLEDMRRANAYQLHHAQSTAINKHPSMVPFVKMASFENK
jgi:sigma-E factor negative regulatory protein RseA